MLLSTNQINLVLVLGWNWFFFFNFFNALGLKNHTWKTFFTYLQYHIQNIFYSYIIYYPPNENKSNKKYKI